MSDVKNNETEEVKGIEIGKLGFYDSRDSSRDRLSSATFELGHSTSEYKKRAIRAFKRAVDEIGASNAKYICIKLKVTGGNIIPIDEIIKAILSELGVNLGYCKF
jgi:hypothetical protein